MAGGEAMDELEDEHGGGAAASCPPPGQDFGDRD
jgi:hypothetical protein